MNENEMVVLVVDDDRSVLQMFGTVLHEALGVSTVLAEDGQDALEQVRRNRPALVILDVLMPTSADGLFIARTLKANPLTSSIPIIAVSCDAPARTALANGCDDFVAKPFDLDVFIAKVKKYLGGNGKGSPAVASA